MPHVLPSSRFARLLGLSALCATVLLASGCGMVVIRGSKYLMSAYGSHPEQEVNTALADFSAHVAHGEPDLAAAAFEPRGEVWPDQQRALMGRDAIAQHLRALTDAGQLVAFDLRATTTTVNGDTVTQDGTFRREAQPSGTAAPVVTNGRFDAEWSRQADGKWLLRRLRTISAVG